MAEGPRKFLNLESLKCHFLDFGEDLTEFKWSENSVLVCQNLQFSSTKWAKAYLYYLINYILDKLQESMGNMGLNDKSQHDFEKKIIISKLLGGCSPPPVATALYI